MFSSTFIVALICSSVAALPLGMSTTGLVGHVGAAGLLSFVAVDNYMRNSRIEEKTDKILTQLGNANTKVVI